MSAFRKVMDYLGLGRDSAYGGAAATPAPRWQRAVGAIGVTVMLVTFVLTRSWITAAIANLAFMAILLGPSMVRERRARAQPPEPGADDNPR